MDAIRRSLIKAIGINGYAIALNSSVVVLTFGSGTLFAKKEPTNSELIEAWMNAWMPSDRSLDGTLHLSRFVEPIYFLTRPIAWKPNSGQEAIAGEVKVPIGFVTDFASIPRPFWSLVRPDGEYTYPAIIHDYLYWVQTVPRATADEIFRLGMLDIGVDSGTVMTIYGAVRAAGKIAWKNNRKLYDSGERRILKAFPDSPTVRWRIWKKKPGVFVAESRPATRPQ